MIQIKTDAEIAKMRVAGLVVGRRPGAAHPGRRARASAPATSTRSPRPTSAPRARVPSFMGYHGFPATICASVNDQIVHGIPSMSEVLREGDIVSIDCGAIVDGWHGDAAITVAVGEHRPRAAAADRVTEESMWRGIAAARLGGRLSDICHAIEEYAPQPLRLRHRRGVRRPRHRHRDAPGPARAQLRQAPAAARSWSRAWRWRSSRWSTSASGTPGARRRLDRGHQDGSAERPLRAHLHADRRRARWC